MRYIALLRGINVSGKNRIPMKELKNMVESAGFTEVVTYINSGNIIFTSDIDTKDKVVSILMNKIKDKFDLEIPVYIITVNELQKAINNAPSWWGKDDKSIYDNIIFILPPLTYANVYNEIGDANENYEKIDYYEDIIFWSFELKSYSKTNWIKTASSSINSNVTIRTANTIRKLLELNLKHNN